MSGYRKLSRTAAQRKALLRSQVTQLLYHGHIVTTEAKAREVSKIAEGLIALATKEYEHYETVTVTCKVPKKDASGKRVKEERDGKKVTVYLEEQKVTEVPKEGKGRKKGTKKIDMAEKMFTEIAPKYVNRNGGYTRIVKIAQRPGDGAMKVLLELV